MVVVVVNLLVVVVVVNLLVVVVVVNLSVVVVVVIIYPWWWLWLYFIGGSGSYRQKKMWERYKARATCCLVIAETSGSSS